MSHKRLSLFNYDVVRELCDNCSKERFHFVPIGTAPATGACARCGEEAKVADLSETSLMRLVTQPNGEFIVVPVVRDRA